MGGGGAVSGGGGAVSGGGGAVSGGGAGGQVPCYSSTTTDVPECADLELCATDLSVAAVVDSTNCVAGKCSWLLSREPSNSRDTLTYEDDRIFAFLEFSSLGGVTSSAELQQRLQYGRFAVFFETRGPKAGRAAQFAARNADEIEVLEWREGSVELRISFSYESPYQFVLSSTQICGDTNNCMCSFGTVRGQASFDIVLPIDGL